MWHASFPDFLIRFQHYTVIGNQLFISNDRNRVRWVVLGLLQDGACTDLVENLSVNSLKGDLSNATAPLFSLANTLKETNLSFRNKTRKPLKQSWFSKYIGYRITLLRIVSWGFSFLTVCNFFIIPLPSIALFSFQACIPAKISQAKQQDQTCKTNDADSGNGKTKPCFTSRSGSATCHRSRWGFSFRKTSTASL